MIYDCFSFFNELDLLEIRLNVLADVVDEFIIVEATQTHSGKPKPCYLDENIDRFSSFPINHAVIDFAGTAADPLGREIAQREFLTKCLSFKDNDWVIISDLDEIPNPESIKLRRSRRFVAELYYFYLNTSANQMWTKGSYMIPGDVARRASLQALRMGNDLAHIMSGWHFSSLGGEEKVIQKLESFHHTEFDNKESKKTIMNYHRTLHDIHGSPLHVVPIDESYPEYIQKNYHNYPTLVWQPST